MVMGLNMGKRLKTYALSIVDSIQSLNIQMIVGFCYSPNLYT